MFIQTEIPILIIAAAAGCVVGAVAAWWLSRKAKAQARIDGRADRDAEVARTAVERESLRSESSRLGGELSDAREEARQWREACQRAEQRLTETATRAQEQGLAAKEYQARLEKVREEFSERFKVLASEVLEDKSQRFVEQNQANLDTILNPLREQLGDFRKLVVDAYQKEGNERVSLRSELQTELKRLFEMNHRLSDEANSLARALSTENRTQGYWGELRLERLLEASGLERGREYLTQESFVDSGGDRYRPDAIVRLPEGKDILIDAKVALTGYRESCDAVDAVDREQALARHLVAMRTHVRLLGEKNYAALPDVQAPDMVLMFVPVEAAFLEALRRDPALYEDAFARKVVMVGPSNLLAALRLVAHLWRTDQQSHHAAFVFKRAAAMYDKFVGFVDDLGKVGEALDRAQKAHQSALGKLASGRGNLLRRVEELRQLGAAPAKRIPRALLDAAEDGTDEETRDVDADGTSRAAPESGVDEQLG